MREPKGHDGMVQVTTMGRCASRVGRPRQAFDLIHALGMLGFDVTAVQVGAKEIEKRQRRAVRELVAAWRSGRVVAGARPINPSAALRSPIDRFLAEHPEAAGYFPVGFLTTVERRRAMRRAGLAAVAAQKQAQMKPVIGLVKKSASR